MKTLPRLVSSAHSVILLKTFNVETRCLLLQTSDMMVDSFFSDDTDSLVTASESERMAV